MRQRLGSLSQWDIFGLCPESRPGPAASHESNGRHYDSDLGLCETDQLGLLNGNLAPQPRYYDDGRGLTEQESPPADSEWSFSCSSRNHHFPLECVAKIL
jgi:hypothetical protein